MPDNEVAEFRANSAAAAAVIERKSPGFTIPGGNPLEAVTVYVSRATSARRPIRRWPA